MAKANTSQTASRGTDRTRALFRFINLFRVLQASVYTMLAFSTLAVVWTTTTRPGMARATALAYLAFALAVLAFSVAWPQRTVLRRLPWLLLVDIGVALLAMLAMQDSRTGIAIMLVISIAGGALLLPLRTSLALAATATFAMLGQAVFDAGAQAGVDRDLLESGLFGFAYFAAAALCFALARQLRATEALATKRGVDLANLEQVNELVIRRMRTGVLLVDEGNQIHLMNESAWLLLDSPPATERDLGQLAPELSRRLYHWRTTGKLDETSVALADGVPEVVPRFTRLSASDDDSHMLIFLDDTSLVSRRAEELTLTSLGRLSASIAHEIRNPLAAIRYSAQLLAESEELDEADQRMIEIINNNCRRLNEIIEDILQLSRRERSRPETIDFSRWVGEFVDEYENSNDLGNDSLRAMVRDVRVTGVADPQQLQQVVWNLVQNALRYGRLPDEPARVTLIARQDGAGLPLLEVIDRGPGIPHKVAARIFEPFYTTHQLGTGLGLYLARQMCEANQASLEYVPVPGGGSCFRITLSPASHARDAG